MSDLKLEVLDARAEPYAAVPTIMFRMRMHETSGGTVHAVALRAQIRVEPARRTYDSAEEERLYELFDIPKRWGSTCKAFLLAHTGITVTAFEGSTEFDLPMVCTYDFEVIGTKYLHNVRQGDIPLEFQFAGSIFTKGETGFAAEPVGWNKDVAFKMPAQVWHDCMDVYFPGSGWIRLRKDLVDRLAVYKTKSTLPTWDDALEFLLKEAESKEAESGGKP